MSRADAICGHFTGIPSCVARSPSSGADKNIIVAVGSHLAVDLLDFAGYEWVVGRGEFLGTDIHDLADAVDRAVAERRVGAHDEPVVGQFEQVFVDKFLAIDYRADLQPVEMAFRTLSGAVDGSGKLYFHRAAHLPLSGGEHEVEPRPADRLCVSVYC